MIRYSAILLAGMILSKVALAQTDTQTLESALKGKQKMLRSYSADTLANYDWVDGKLVAQPVKMYTFGMFITQSVTLTKNKLVLDGERGTVVSDVKANKVFLAGKTPMWLEVDLHDADPSIVISHLQEMMFFPDAQVATAALPELVADKVPFDISRTPKAKQDSVMVFDGGRWIRLDRQSTKMIPPQLISSVDPELSAEARRAGVKGSARFVFYVSETGQVREVWLANALGFGLDERAANAVRKYVFTPELCNGHPVGTALMVDVNF